MAAEAVKLKEQVGGKHTKHTNDITGTGHCGLVDAGGLGHEVVQGEQPARLPLPAHRTRHQQQRRQPEAGAQRHEHHHHRPWQLDLEHPRLLANTGNYWRMLANVGNGECLR